MTVFIVCGGCISHQLLKGQIESCKDKIVIACDGGIVHLLDVGIHPDYAIGDFDSAGEDAYKLAISKGIETIKLNPIKDDTDSEAAINLAFEKSSDADIIIMGCTGTRLDHVLGNVALLGLALKKNRKVYLLDETNKIQMIGPGTQLVLEKSKQYGKYVSVFPYMGPVKGLCLQGFKYPLSGYTAQGFTTITVSNEIVDDQATISIDEGYLIVLETRD